MAARSGGALAALSAALLLAASSGALTLDGVELSVGSDGSTETFSGMELTGSSDSDDDTNTSDGEVLLQEGDLELTSSDLSSGGSGIEGSGGGWKVSDWRIDVHADPFLGAIVAVANLSEQTKTFDITLDVPVDPVSPQSLLDGSLAQNLDEVAGTLTDDAEASLYVARLDEIGIAGTEVGPTPPFSVSGTLSSRGSIGADSFYGVVGPATQESIGIRWRFALEPDSAALFDSTLNVVAVPEPGTLVLCGLGLLGLGAAARRHPRARA